MSKLLRILAGLALYATPVLCLAEPSKVPHGTVELISAVQAIQPGSSFQLGLHFQLEPGWHIYWKNPGDSGQPPRLKWNLPEGLKAGDFDWPTPKRLPVGPLLDYGYEGDVLLPVTFEAAPTMATAPKHVENIEANLRVLVCRETCIPGKAALALTLPVQSGKGQAKAVNTELFAAANAARPKQLPAGWQVTGVQSASAIQLSVTGAPAFTALSFIPEQNRQIENAAPQAFTGSAGQPDLTLKKKNGVNQQASATIQGLLLATQGGERQAYAISADLRNGPTPAVGTRGAESPEATPRLMGVLLLAFAGGLILNLMPCVFPVLSLKILSLLEHSGSENRTIRLSAGVYTAGVLVSFWAVVAVLLILRSTGQGLGWGFQLQSPGFVAFLICLLFIFGLSLIGVFEIGGSIMNIGGGLTQRGQYSSSFFTGVLATVVATPCTAPFMGVAVGYALSQPASVCVLVFTAMAIGLASPFLLLSFFPQLSRFLPRPGAWMETLKQALAFLIFATVIWLLWVIGQQIGVNQLALLLFALLALSICGWMAGRWPLSGPVKWSALVLGLAATVFCSMAVKRLDTNELASANAAQKGGAGALKWEAFSPEKLASYRASGKPVLIDFTAAWCLTCQVNDRVVFHSSQVEQRLSKSDIALLRADWTSNDPKITEYLAKFGRSGIPFYVIYGAGAGAPPVTLPDGLLTPSVFLQSLGKINL